MKLRKKIANVSRLIYHLLKKLLTKEKQVEGVKNA